MMGPMLQHYLLVSSDQPAAHNLHVYRTSYRVNYAYYSCIIHLILSPIQKIEPGLEQSEAFYSLAYVVLCIGHSSSAIAVGILFNFIPTWYLFLVTTLSHTLGYLLYALATHAWMMLLARGLTGLSLGAFTSLEFAYFGVSYGKYTENLKILGKFEEEKAVKRKGYLFSSDSIGHVLGVGIGLGMNSDIIINYKICVWLTWCLACMEGVMFYNIQV